MVNYTSSSVTYTNWWPRAFLGEGREVIQWEDKNTDRFNFLIYFIYETQIFNRLYLSYYTI